MNLLVTGGAGFIGSNLIRHIINQPAINRLVNLDCLTYAGHLANLTDVERAPNYVFEKVDLRDRESVRRVVRDHQITHVMHLAAESHVDRSISGPGDFITTNIVGTFNLLEACREFWLSNAQLGTRFHHVSTDEVYGSLGATGYFTETTPYAPNSPYSASKASSDMLVRTYHHTYGLNTVITNCSNNYGPYQFPEKLIPLIIANALAGKPLPVYGDGMNVRDWLYVSDHCSAVRRALEAGKPGETYNVGGRSEKPNIEIVRQVCALLDEMRPDPAGPHERLITYVKDRPGHDRRYAIDATRIEADLGWKPAETFDSGIRKTVAWYLANQEWVAAVQSGAYREWLERNYAGRAAAGSPN